ncbi:hypothetical protein G5T42_00565 [Microbacterium sp. 4R-513]|uniref:hypothetical protein n=1 Tax=Microbacterium sp. 4R-513 TaxID=2567934 RepID=UPI0013E1EFCC|nr:hypothetical protein [Microbacterium sp. 4R-513]QIG38156.1 hypothetical protein G5T42_00565 [Microbacterium sp. 4R-513]
MIRFRSSAAALAAVALALTTLTACAPEPTAPSPSATASSPVASPSSTPSATPSATATAGADADIELPASCEQIYSASMLASLNAANPPLNHPDVTMHSTQNAELLETLTSGIPTLRCSWGTPSEYGLATNVSTVDPAQSAAVLSALNTSGFGCEDAMGGTICRIEQKTINLDDKEVTFGETHFLRGNGWVSTAWINFAPEGYTEDIVATLWG